MPLISTRKRVDFYAFDIQKVNEKICWTCRIDVSNKFFLHSKKFLKKLDFTYGKSSFENFLALSFGATWLENGKKLDFQNQGKLDFSKLDSGQTRFSTKEISKSRKLKKKSIFKIKETRFFETR